VLLLQSNLASAFNAWCASNANNLLVIDDFTDIGNPLNERLEQRNAIAVSTLSESSLGPFSRAITALVRNGRSVICVALCTDAASGERCYQALLETEPMYYGANALRPLRRALMITRIVTQTPSMKR